MPLGQTEMMRGDDEEILIRMRALPYGDASRTRVGLMLMRCWRDELRYRMLDARRRRPPAARRDGHARAIADANRRIGRLHLL